jgi:hypothetical protein
MFLRCANAHILWFALQLKAAPTVSVAFFISSFLTERQITSASIARHLRYPNTISNLFISSSFIFVGTEQSHILPPSRPTVTSDTTFLSSISTPTSPIDSVGTLKVCNHCHATSPFTCCLTANLQPINHWVLTFNIQCVLHIGVTHLSPVSLTPSSIVLPPSFRPSINIGFPPSQCPIAAVSGPSKASTARHPSSFRKAQKISRPSAATTAHRCASVCDLSKLYCKLFPTEFLTPRVLAGTTRIMDTSTAKLCGHFVSHRSHAPPSPPIPPRILIPPRLHQHRWP